ncbi:hypothetical protein CBR_g12583 [Chara braunii]|uniref:Trafficking protein particle complex subunit n=1 Tax=Chara braunii TaxID=69332 RepID=A0A388KS29_CHABU|nr:hypothetical protein CBR_g12583 [Chara braunii]|eukprot:GBG72864.1 hypothetical protein CBR_g12583 [Chara braunii]
MPPTHAVHTFYMFNRQGVCLHYHEWNRPLTTLSPHEDQKLMFGLLFSLKSFTAKMDPMSDNKAALGAPQPTGQGSSFRSFRTNTYKLSFMESPSGVKTDIAGNMAPTGKEHRGTPAGIVEALPFEPLSTKLDMTCQGAGRVSSFRWPSTLTSASCSKHAPVPFDSFNKTHLWLQSQQQQQQQQQNIRSRISAAEYPQHSFYAFFKRAIPFPGAGVAAAASERIPDSEGEIFATFCVKEASRCSSFRFS